MDIRISKLSSDDAYGACYQADSNGHIGVDSVDKGVLLHGPLDVLLRGSASGQEDDDILHESFQA